MSFRSKGRVDVSAVAAGSAGRAPQCRGCSVTGTIADVKKRVLEALAAVLP